MTEPTVQQLWTAPAAGEPMSGRTSAEAVAGVGLAGDRYAEGTGHYSPYDVCQVTFVGAAALDCVREAFDLDLDDGRHRRNVVVDGDVLDLLETRFRVGGAVFEGTRRRPPCAHLRDVTGEDDIVAALGEDRGGICADVVEGGTVAVDDAVTVVERLDDPDSLAAALRERHEE
ncbi:MAG: MOSC domain-containing protein [Halolamina sp.]